MSGPAPRLADYLGHILEAIARVQRYTEGMDEADFAGNPLVQDAVTRNLEIVGEAGDRAGSPAGGVGRALRAGSMEQEYPDRAVLHEEIVEGIEHASVHAADIVSGDTRRGAGPAPVCPREGGRGAVA